MVNWEDGQLEQGAYVEINGVQYPVVMPQYSGNTPVTAENLNKMQGDLQEEIKETKKEISELIKEQKILWNEEGGSLMIATQNAPLSEKVSDQKNGIVLIFSAYSNGVAQDWGWSSHFVPKKLVELFNGGGHVFSIAENEGYGIRSAKYIYIEDEKLRGHANNVGTHDNINNSLAVLRYVIGV